MGRYGTECLANFDLCQRIASFVDFEDLCSLELVNRSWRTVSVYQFAIARELTQYKYLAFRQRSDYDSDKKICFKIDRNRAAALSNATAENKSAPTQEIILSVPMEENPTGDNVATTVGTDTSTDNSTGIDKLTGGLLVIGGSFGGLHNETCWVQDHRKRLAGRLPLQQERDLPVRLGSMAATTDAAGHALVLGGWDDVHEQVLSCIYALDMRFIQQGWVQQPSLPSPRCFAAAERTVRGDIVLLGGGSSPYRGAQVFNDCLLRRVTTADEDSSNEDYNYLRSTAEKMDIWWDLSIPAMNFQRCGHSAVTLFDDSVFVVGGYAGGSDYLSSAEQLDRNLERWVTLPSMSVPRSGMAAVLGPNGSVYVAGGSPDGSQGHRSVERYDPREGKWTPLAPMHYGRGYTSGCVGSSETFFVSGGCDGHFQGGVECYDFRLDKWRVLQLPSRSGHHSVLHPLLAAAAIEEGQQQQTNGIEEGEALPTNEEEEEDDTSISISITSSHSGSWESIDEGEGEPAGGGPEFDEYLIRACHQMLYVL